MILDVILRIAAKMFIPFIIMFGLYVQLHGDFGPGGGFQAGVIIAAAIILYAIVFGLQAALIVVPKWVVEFMVPLGVLIYSAVGVWSMVMGGEYLNYNVLLHAGEPIGTYDAVHGQHWGVFLVEIGVLVTVTGTMLTIFYSFAGRGRVTPGGDDA
ncbi:MAG: Na(+)/H(+) antiporter subunit B [Paracoccaceae bacterium]